MLDKQSQLSVAQRYAEFEEPDKLISESGSALRCRHSNVLERFRDVSWVKKLQEVLPQSGENDSQKLFFLYHSSLECLLELMCEEMLNEYEEAANQIVDHAETVAASHVYVYELSSASHAHRFFPYPEHYIRVLGKRESDFHEKIERSWRWIAKWSPQAFAEVRKYIRYYVFTEDAFFDGRSLDGEPGHSVFCTKTAFEMDSHEGAQGSEVLRDILLAAQVVHEARHQKGFFVNRILDPSAEKYPSAFVPREFHELRMAPPFEHHPFFGLMDSLLAVGSEVMFLSAFAKMDVLKDEEREVLEGRLGRKKKYFYQMTLSAEMHHEKMTELGKAAYQSIQAMMAEPVKA